MKDFIKKNWLRLLLTIACLVADYFVGIIGLLWLAWGLGVDGFLAFGSFVVDSLQEGSSGQDQVFEGLDSVAGMPWLMGLTSRKEISIGLSSIF